MGDARCYALIWLLEDARHRLRHRSCQQVSLCLLLLVHCSYIEAALHLGWRHLEEGVHRLNISKSQGIAVWPSERDYGREILDCKLLAYWLE